MTTKIATCCYCGTKAALVLAGSKRHELACRSCGAPLSQLKQLKVGHPEDGRLVGAPRPRNRARPARPAKKRPGFLQRAWDEIVDQIEDAVEDVFD